MISRTALALALALAALPATAVAQTSPTQAAPVIVGTNVNMVGGPASYVPGREPELIGDPFLQRQNEPSLALSSRNPCHILAGANDYRAVDLEEALSLENADAWLGVFKSLDCGATWSSYLLAGHPADNSPAGLASPLKGLPAAADATVRAGTSGLFYYSGIAFDRGDNGVGKVFVARFLDNNNRDGADPIEYLDTTAIDTGTSGQFLDKPWIATDIPRGAASCTVDGQTVPAGNAYLTYSAFVGSGNNVRTKIHFSRSTDCGATWSNPSKLSERFARNQGTVMAVDPATGAVYIAWREFTDPNDAKSVHSILVVKSTDGGRSFTPAQRVEPLNPVTGRPYLFEPFDQISTPVTFRTNAYPTMAIVPAEAEGRPSGQPGRVYLAWAARGFGGARPSDARIVMSSSIDGANWTYPRAADDQAGAGHQIMPAMAFAGGRLALAYYDLRLDAAGLFQSYVVEYGQQYWQYCVDTFAPAGPGMILSCMAANNTAPRRHTLDLRAAMVDPACLLTGACGFTSAAVSSTEVSRYIDGALQPGGVMTQRQYNRPNLPLFRKGTYPFIGDYIDIAGPAYLPDGQGGWIFNTGQTAGRPAPIFQVSWADNRDVKKPASGDWSTFTPSLAGPNALQCVPGQAGIRNQNIYAAQLRPGLLVAAPLNAKKITALQRSFVVVAQNATAEQRTYNLEVVTPDGVIASFDQFLGFDGASAPLTTIAAVIPPRSSISRTVFVGLVNAPADPSQAPHVVVPVVVTETGVATPSTDTVYLNPDFDNPDFDNPDFDNAEMHNPDFDNPDFDNPDFDNPDFDNFTLNAAFLNPDFDNPDFDNPDFDNPDFDNPDFDNPDFDNPDFDNPDFDNPDFDNPDFDNPDFDNPDFDNAAVADVTWPVYNTGNTTSAYKANFNINNPPAGVRYQLLVRRTYPSPQPSLFCGPGLQQSVQNQALVNIVQPDITAYLRDRSFNDPSRTNATFYLAPGEKAKVTLRAYCETDIPGETCPALDMTWALSNISLGVVAQAANCVVCTGAGCTNSDGVAGGTECTLDEGTPPKDIYDPVPPIVFGPAPQPTAIDANNDGSEGVTFVVTATDNLEVGAVACEGGMAAISLISAAGDQYTFAATFPVGATAVTCTASDTRVTLGQPAPNTATVSFNVVVEDVTAPTFDAGAAPGAPFGPGNPAEATGPEGAVVTYTTPPASDSNGGPVTVACAPLSGSTFPIGTTPVDCTATDGSGNSTPPTNLFDVTVLDTTAPVVTVTGAPAAAIEGSTLGGAAATFAASASDLVDGGLAATCAPASGTTFPVGATTVTCSSTDAHGNTGSAAFTVTVVDTTPPVVTLNGPSSVTIEAGSAFADPGASGADIVSGTLPTAISGTVNTLVPGTYALTYAATDVSGNTGTAARIVTVVDTTAPIVEAHAGVTAEATGATGAIVTYTSPAWTDTVSGGGTASCVPASGSVFALGATTVTCTATDGTGNSASSSFTVTVRDTTSPIIAAHAVVIAEAAGATGAIVAYTSPSWTDAVSGTGTAICTPASESLFALGSTIITCTAGDAALNSATPTTFTVLVVDTTPPVVTLNGGASITIEAGSAFTDPGATAADLVSGSRPVTVSGTVNTLVPGTYTLTYTAMDASGNRGTATRAVTVRDTVPPVTLTASVSPQLLWPPDGTIVNVTVSGQVFDAGSGAVRIAWSVIDEYGTHQPTGTATVANGPYSFQLPLLRERRGSDKDGRHYTIRLTVYDAAGNSLVLPNPPVVNVHDQSGK